MIILNIDRDAETKFFSGKEAKKFYMDTFGMGMFSVEPDGPWTKITLGPDEVFGTIQVVGRMVEQRVDGVLIEQYLVEGEKSKYIRLPLIGGRTHYYLMGIRKSNRFNFWDYDLLRQATRNSSFKGAFMNNAQLVISGAEGQKTYVTKGIIVDPLMLNSIIEEERELKQAETDILDERPL